METRAHILGYKAALDGKSASDNPYKHRGARAAWVEGFDEGCWEKAKREDRNDKLATLADSSGPTTENKP